MCGGRWMGEAAAVAMRRHLAAWAMSALLRGWASQMPVVVAVGVGMRLD